MFEYAAGAAATHRDPRANPFHRIVGMLHTVEDSTVLWQVCTTAYNCTGLGSKPAEQEVAIIFEVLKQLVLSPKQ